VRFWKEKLRDAHRRRHAGLGHLHVVGGDDSETGGEFLSLPP
jgi:6-phosphofructokinase